MSCFGKGCYALLLAFVLLFIGVGGAMAQQIFGSIYGTVTDPTGSPVSNAKVTIADVTKGTSAQVITDASGNYTKGQLIPDTYKVTIEAPGFNKVVSSDISVSVDQAAQFNAALTVGSVDTSVEVTAAAPLLQADRADVAQTFTAKQIAELPTIGRNLQSFELLNPGTVKLPWQHASDENPQGSIQTIVNGQLFDSTGYYLDGTINQDPILGIIVINPTFDSVNEVKQADQDYDAEFGYTGAGVLTYSTKSGTNQFHGDGFESLEINTPGFQDFGRNPFDENTSAGVPTTHYNQYGGSIGGRVIKDKLFFFGDAQLTRNYRGGSVLTSVPTAAERTGNLSDWLAQGSEYQVYDPTTGNPATGQGRTPYANNMIPASQLSPQALAIMNYWPLPNTAASGNAPYNNYEASGTNSITGNQWNTRWDYYVNEKNTLFGRYSYAAFTEQAPGAFGALGGGPDFSGGNYAGSSQTLNQSAAAGWTYTFSPTTINEFRWGYMRYHITDVPNGYGQSPAAEAGIPGLNTSLTTSGMPAFNISNPVGNEQLGYSLTVNQCNCPLDEFERQYQFVDNLTKVAGNHNLKFGIDGRYALNLRVPSDNHRAGELNFNDSVTGVVPASGGAPIDGLALGTFLLGDVTSFNRYVSSSLDAEERQKRVFYYAQDEWHVTPKLVFTYGVRWEWVYPETVNSAGNGAELNIATGQLDVFGLGGNSSHGYQEMNWHDFAPRVSVAYQVTPKTVIRAGYGWSYSLGTFGSTFGHNVTQNPPVLINQALNQQQSSGGCPTTFCDVFTLSQGAPAYTNSFVPNANGTIPLEPGGGLSLKTRPGIMTMPVVYAYNLTAQRQLTSKISISAGYVGNQGRHAPLGTDMSYNENTEFFVPGVAGGAFPFDGLLGPKLNYGWTYDIESYCNCANNQYNALQVLSKINAAAGLTMQANYTYQYAKGDGWGGNEGYTFSYDRPLGYGNDDFTPHNQIVFAGNYAIPFGRGLKYGASINRAVDAIVGGWNIGTITTYYSGIPFMPTIENYGSNTQPYTGPNNRPDVGTGSPYASNQNRNQWILPLASGAYTLPASNTFGNYPINTLIGPQFVNEDMSLSKQFSITERMKFKLRMDATNAFNHTNLGSPNADIQSSTVGQITSTAFGGAYQMRRLQFTGSFTF